MSTPLIRTKLAMLGLLVATAITGCGTDPVTDDVQIREDVIDLACTCPGAFLQPSEAACRTELGRLFGLPTESQEACLRQVYDDYSDELNPALDCRYEAGLALLECTETALATCPPPIADSTACTSAYADALNACPTPSRQAQEALDACSGS